MAGTKRVGWNTSFREGLRAWPHVWRRSLLVAACIGFFASLARALGWIAWIAFLDELSVGVIAFVATQGAIATLFLGLLVLRGLSTRHE